MKAYIVKAKSKLGKLPKINDYKNLITYDDFSRKLDVIKKIYPQLGNTRDKLNLEIGLNNILDEDLKSLSYFLEGYEKEFFIKYISSFEVMAIQNIILAILNNSLNDSYSMLKKNPFAKNLIIKKDMNFEDFVDALNNTRYHRTLVPFLNENMTKDSVIFLIANSLTKFYFRDLLASTTKFPKVTAVSIRDYIGMEIDIYNIEMIYRTKNFFNLNSYEIFNYLIEGGKNLKADKLKALSQMNINDFIGEIKNTSYGDIFNGELSINKLINEQKYQIIKPLKNMNNILFLIYSANIMIRSNYNLVSIIELDSSFTIDEKESFLVKG